MKKTKVDDEINKTLSTSTPPKFNSEPARQIKPRKRAADFLSDGEDDNEKKVNKSNTSPATANHAMNQEKPSKKSKRGLGSRVTVEEVPNPDALPINMEIGEKKEGGKTKNNGKKSHDKTDITDHGPTVEAPVNEEEELEDDMTSMAQSAFASTMSLTPLLLRWYEWIMSSQ